MTKNLKGTTDSRAQEKEPHPPFKESSNPAIENFLQFLARMLAMRHLRGTLEERQDGSPPPIADTKEVQKSAEGQEDC